MLRPGTNGNCRHLTVMKNDAYNFLLEHNRRPSALSGKLMRLAIGSTFDIITWWWAGLGSSLRGARAPGVREPWERMSKDETNDH